MIEAVGCNEERDGVRSEVDWKEGSVGMTYDEAGVETKER
jgi:hypothetical protein